MATRLGDVLRALPARLRVEGAAKQSLEVAQHRLVIGGMLFAVAFVVVGLRLVDVTLLKEGHEPKLAQAPKTRALEMERADIVDRNGVLLATSLPTASLYANPRVIADPDETAARLARTLTGINQAELAQKLGSERSFVWIQRNLTPRQEDLVNRLGVPGLFFQREERRVYPHGTLTGHVVGFANIDNRGLAGIEQYADDRLRQEREPLRLSLDMRVQHMLRGELAAAMAEFRAIGASGIVLDARTGEIVAMVSLPDFDANRPALAPPEARFNRNTLGIYEPGSVFKIFNTAMALEAGTVGLNGGYDASRPIHIARFTISDFKGKNRWLSVPEIFMYSSNIGSVKMALDVGTQRQREFLGRFGMLSPVSIELPEVGAPLIPKPWSQISTMTVAFGHGISVSPLHLATGIAAVVNGGILRPATLLKRPDNEPAPGQRVISQRVSEQMRGLLRLVVEKGTGKAANVPGYLVGGKTGTAEKIVNGVYKKSARISSFVAAFPISNPRYVIVAVLDEPQGNKQTMGYATGGWVAAPLVGRVIGKLAAIMGIEPADEPSPAPALPDTKAAKVVPVSTRG